MPREALRFILVENSMTAAVWGILCFLFQAAAIFFILKGIGKRLKARQFVILILFFGVGCAPYLLLTWNCYAYYISIGLLIYPLLAGMAGRSRKIFGRIALFAILSSLVSVFGNFFLDYPALMARAFWADRQLKKIARA